MAFCKICVCGNIIRYERTKDLPDVCPFCGRGQLELLPPFREDDPQVKVLLNQNNPTDETEIYESEEVESGGFILVSSVGDEIEIPHEGGVIGRTGIGADVLAKYPSVSKQHLKIYPCLGERIIIEDISKYGSFINGIKMEYCFALFHHINTVKAFI